MRSRWSFTVAESIGGVALVATGLVAFRVHPALGCFVSALLLMTVVPYYQIRRTCDAIRSLLATREVLPTVLKSLCVAFVILGSATMTAITLLLTIGGLTGWGQRPADMLNPVPMVPSILADWYFAARGRRELWSSPRCVAPRLDGSGRL